jgi:hypothetical protein
LDAFVSEARVAATDAQLELREIEVYLGSDVPGERAIGLAAVQATADPGTFDRIIEAVQKSTPFEQYQALSALESLRPGLSEGQREEVIGVLDTVKLQLPAGPAGRALVERILTGIERDSAPLAAS